MRLLAASVALGLASACTVRTPEGFVRIPAGSFLMGNPAGAEDHMGNDAPHEVRITRDFFLQPTRRIEGGPVGRNANVGFRLARTAR